MFTNIASLILAKEKEVEGIDLILNSSTPSNKSAGNLTYFLDSRNTPEAKKDMFVNQLGGSTLPECLEVVRQERKALDVREDSHQLRALYTLLDRFEKFVKEFMSVLREKDIEAEGRDLHVMEYLKKISTARPGKEDDLLRDLDFLLTEFKTAIREKSPPAKTEADKAYPVPADRYHTLMNFMNKTQHKFS